VNRVGQNLVRRRESSVYDQGAGFRGGECFRTARRVLLRQLRPDPESG
jgi:hypothetical protein